MVIVFPCGNGLQLIGKYYFKCLWVHVLACVSAPWGSAAVISGDRVRGQCSFAVERRHWCTGLPSGMGTFYRSGQSRQHQTHVSLHLWLVSSNLHIFIIFGFISTKVEMWRLWRFLVTKTFILCPDCGLMLSTSSLSSHCMRETLRAPEPLPGLR